jgi:hypothetical protein
MRNVIMKLFDTGSDKHRAARHELSYTTPTTIILVASLYSYLTAINTAQMVCAAATN